MFSHVMVGTNDLEASKKFYDAVLGTLGISPGFIDDNRRIFYMSPVEQAHPSIPFRSGGEGSRVCGAAKWTDLG